MSFAALYVPQRATALPGPLDPKSGPRTGPAEAMIREESCVVFAGPGGGKSSLLRTRLGTGVERWLAGRTDEALPIMVSAAALAGAPLAEGLAAAAARDLSLVEALPAEFFGGRPAPEARWLVLVDGLDELPRADQRRALGRIDAAVTRHADVYRFVLATRPLPEDVLEKLNPRMTRIVLEPFSEEELAAVARAWFATLPEPDRSAERFLGTLSRTRLTTLAKTPLMMALLCQLHVADPGESLPSDRSDIYRRFVELFYERRHSDLAHDGILGFSGDLERYGSDAVRQAERFVQCLPDLLVHLAAERERGNRLSAPEVVSAHPEGKGPAAVPGKEWRAFVAATLRRTGLLVEDSGDLRFLHHTIGEYLAAQRVTDAASTLREVAGQFRLQGFTHRERSTGAGGWLTPVYEGPFLNDSRAGFVIDAGIEADSRATRLQLGLLARRGGLSGWRFLFDQVGLGTKIPDEVLQTAIDGCAAFALRDDSIRGRRDRLDAIAALERLNYPYAVDLYVAMATNTENQLVLPGPAMRRTRVAKAKNVRREKRDALLGRMLEKDWIAVPIGAAIVVKALAQRDLEDIIGEALTDYRESAAQKAIATNSPRLAELAHAIANTNRPHNAHSRVRATKILAAIGDPRAPGLYEAIARGASGHQSWRLIAAGELAKTDRRRARAVYAALADDPSLDEEHREQAAEARRTL